MYKIKKQCTTQGIQKNPLLECFANQSARWEEQIRKNPGKLEILLP